MESLPKPNTLQTLQMAIDWHASLEREFRNPILPDNLTEEATKLKLEEIEMLGV